MAFHDEQLPDTVEQGARGGPRFNTTVSADFGGYEQRNANWLQSRAPYFIGYGISDDIVPIVIAHFYNRQGRLHSFPFLDWSDYEIGNVAGSGTPQSIGTGDGVETVFPIFKTYTNGAYSFQRTNIVPVIAGFRPFVNLVEITSGFSVDRLANTLTITTPPPNTHDVAILCTFHVPVRYDTDILDISSITATAGSIPDIPLLEVRGEHTP